MALPPRIPGRPGMPPRPGSPPTVEDSIAAKHATEQLADECGKTEEELEALKARYELYFLGIERLEPNRWRVELKRRVEKLKESFTKNTGLRFRLQTLHARFLSYERLWMRNAREKEAGTYRRDLFKARLRGKDEPAAKPAAEGVAPGAAASAAATPAPSSPSPASPAARTGARPPASTSFSGTSEHDLRALYSAYVDAKKRCKEDVSKLSYDALAKSVQKQVPELMTRFKARSIEFRIEVKDGKAVLKAIPRV